MVIDRLRTRLRAGLHARRRAGAFQRAFDPAAQERLLLLTVDHRIPQSQITPFHHYARDFRDRHDLDIREVEAARYGANPSHPERATIVGYQTNFDIPDAQLDHELATIRARNPGARVIYMDWFAPTDLRMAARLGDRVDGYLTKHLLRDRARYDAPTFGDTTLMDHYGRRFGCDHEVQAFTIPKGFWDKLHLGPSFCTADFMLPVFERGMRPRGARPIDLHARIAVEGTPWYAAMRRECADAVTALEGVACVTGTGVRHDVFLRELRRSKLCFSPFGYGEVCWRDYEAVMTGAVLVKQDMGHVATDPDIFVADETYVPVAWDLSDFAERVEWLLRDDAARGRIAGAAFEVLRDYARNRRFVDHMAPVLGL